MRILFVVHQFFPEFHSGTESVTLRLAKSAQQAGHKVEVLTPLITQRVDPSWHVDEATGFYQYRFDNIAVTAIKRSDIPDSADYSLATHDPLVEKISKYLVSGQFDCCHVMHSMRMASAVKAIADNNIPYILTITDFFLPCYRVNLVNMSGQPCEGPNNGQRCLSDCSSNEWDSSALGQRTAQAKEIVQAATAVICPSGFVAERLRKEYVGVPIKVIPHATNNQRLNLIQNQGALVFAYVGSLIEEKGVDLLIDAFREVESQEVKLKIIGALPEENKFSQDVLSRIYADPRIELVGEVPHSEMPQNLQTIDVLCIPSRVPETFSLVLHEASAVGVPSLVSNMGAIKQSIEKTGAGAVIEDNDVANWATALENVLANPSKLKTWKSNTGVLAGNSDESYCYQMLYRLASANNKVPTVIPAHAQRPSNWKKRLIHSLWPRIQVLGLHQLYLQVLIYRGRTLQMLAIVKRRLLRRPIPDFLTDQNEVKPLASKNPESLKFNWDLDESGSRDYHHALTISGNGYSSMTPEPLFIDAYIDEIFQKRIHAASMHPLEMVSDRTQMNYQYREELELSLTQMGKHQLLLVIQDIEGNAVARRIELTKVPDPQHYQYYFAEGLADAKERQYLDNLVFDELVFDIWIDAASNEDLLPTITALDDQGAICLNLHFYNLSGNQQAEIESCLADTSTLKNSRIVYDKLPGGQESGEVGKRYSLFLEAGEQLGPLTLCQIAACLSRRPETELIYTDHDMIDSSNNHHSPQFSPGWSPDYFLQNDYIGGVFFIKQSPWLSNYLQQYNFSTSSNWRYDLLLRFTETPRVIDHSPKIMWSCLNRAVDQQANMKLVEKSLERRCENATVGPSPIPGHARINWHADSSTKVSIIIPTTGNLELLKPCIESIQQKTDYENYELKIIVNGQGRFPEGIEYCNSLGLKTIVDDEAFNWARLNNRVAAECKSDLLLFLNDDVEILNEGWMTSMVGLATRTCIGTVGSMLLYPGGQIQHAGVLLVDHGGGAAHYFQGMYPDRPIYNNLHQVTREVSASTGACLMVRRDVFLEAGGFDESFKISGNDVDFCLRVEKLGYRNLWTSDSQLIHKESMTRQKDRISFPDEKMMWRRWESQFLAKDPFYNSNFTSEAAVCELPRLANPSV
jgi:glycosyltransferase involved in cell wall biosynthesis/GT2 family glycosyltransferase